MHRYCVLLGLAGLAIATADTLTLKSGRTVHGNYLGGTSRQVRMEVGDKIETYEIGEVSTIQFTGAAPAAAPSAPATGTGTALRRERPNILRPESSTPAPASAARSAKVDIPAGTAITVRMIDGVDSETNRVGETFRASLDEPLMSGGEVVVPRGADAVVKLVDDKEAGRISGKSELKLDLVSVSVNGRTLDVNTEEITQAGESRTAQSGKVIGGTAALGAIIGGIAGGGKGAAIGAVSGAGAGTAVQVLTKGSKVRIPSETRLRFTLRDPVRL